MRETLANYLIDRYSKTKRRELLVLVTNGNQCGDEFNYSGIPIRTVSSDPRYGAIVSEITAKDRTVLTYSDYTIVFGIDWLLEQPEIRKRFPLETFALARHDFSPPAMNVAIPKTWSLSCDQDS